MIDTNALKAEIVRNGMTQESMAKALGIHPKTFYYKIKKGKFNSDEMLKLIMLLDIKDPVSIFFADFLRKEEKDENC